MRKQLVRNISVLFCGLILTASSADALTIDWAVIGNTGNAPDDTGYGAVEYEYSISKTEVTTGQYVEFLNAVAGVDTYGLYNSNMSNFVFYKGISRISGSGTPSDPYKYIANEGWENHPVVYVSWYDAARFVNWLNNGQLTGAQDASTTEDGVYTFSGATSVSTRNAGADYWLPNEDEWYKAAYYDPIASLYYDYATSSDAVPVEGVDANYTSGGYVDYTTEVGELENESPYGTYDQSGNVWEWNETLINGQYRGARGGAWFSRAYTLAATCRNYYSPTQEDFGCGFRVASDFTGDGGTAVPEPLSVGLVLLSVGGLVLRRAKRA